MSRSVGNHTADPCPRCRVEAVRLGSPTPADAGPQVVGYLCESCAHAWTRPIETDLDVHDVVRADLPDATLYGTVWQVEGDRVQILVTRGDPPRWVERWRVIAY